MGLPVLPGDHVLDDRVGDLGDRLSRHLGPVDLQQVGLDVTGREPLRVERDHVPGQPVEATSVLGDRDRLEGAVRSEEHTSELQSLMRNSYAVFCLKKKKKSKSKRK